MPRDTSAHDLGLCGPTRRDLVAATQYCGMFRTPSLRNVAERGVFFHNGVVRSLDDVLRFYVFRDIRPEDVYPQNADGSIAKFNDLPAANRENVDTSDAPFNRTRGQSQVLSAQEMADVVAFLKTLTDGYHDDDRKPSAGSHATPK